MLKKREKTEKDNKKDIYNIRHKIENLKYFILMQSAFQCSEKQKNTTVNMKNKPYVL